MTNHTSESPGSLGVRTFDNAHFYYRVGTTDELVLRTEYGQARFFPEGFEPAPNATVLDVGAHIGVFAVLTALQVPDGTVHALEPGGENFELLEKNIHANKTDNVVAHKLALGGMNGTVRLHHAPGSVGHSIHLNPDWASVPSEPRRADAPPLAAFEDVHCRVLEDFLIDNRIDNVDFMKMNIEGAEYDVLISASERVLRTVSFMRVELHRGADDLCDRMLDRLNSAGFALSVVWTEDPAVKGWLTAERR